MSNEIIFGNVIMLMSRLESMIQQNEQKRQEAQANLQSLEADYNRLLEQCKDLELRNTEKDSQITNLSDQIKALEVRCAERDRHIASLKDQIKGLAASDEQYM